MWENSYPVFLIAFRFMRATLPRHHKFGYETGNSSRLTVINIGIDYVYNFRR